MPYTSGTSAAIGSRESNSFQSTSLIRFILATNGCYNLAISSQRSAISLELVLAC